MAATPEPTRACENTRAEAALRGLAATAIALNSCRSLDELLRTITDRAREIIGAHMAVIGTTIDQSWAQAIQAVSLSDKYAAYRDFDAKPDGSGIYAVVCDRNRPMRLTQAQLEAHPAWRGYGKYADQHPALRGWLAVPLIDSNGRNMGVLQLSDKDQDDFTAEDEGIAVQLAQMASLAIGEARLHESLANSERQFRLLAEAIPQHVLTFGRDGSLHYCNQRWTDYTGLSLPTAQASGWQTAFHPDEAWAVLQAWQQCCAHGSQYEREVRLRRIDGQYRRFLTRAVPITDGDGNIVQWFWTNTDIEESKLAAEALHNAQAELARMARVTTMGELTASIAHEITQPLGAIVSSAGACLRWLAAQKLEEARQAAARVVADGHRAGEIIARIRALAKKAPPQKEWIGINETIREVVALARSEVQRGGIALETRLSDDGHHVPLISADRIQLQQVILNLLMNAIEAMSSAADGPRDLLIRCGTDEAQGVLVTVRDSGPGLDPKVLDRLFDPFYTTKPHGMGMGLAISRSIIEAHGGRLWATANDDGGATFQFTLPIGGEEMR
jgi:PAS domain S-box-containing protein